MSSLPSDITLAISVRNHAELSLPSLKSSRTAGMPLIKQAAIAPIVVPQRLSLVFLKAEMSSLVQPIRPIQSMTLGLSSLLELSKRYHAMLEWKCRKN